MELNESCICNSKLLLLFISEKKRGEKIHGQQSYLTCATTVIMRVSRVFILPHSYLLSNPLFLKQREEKQTTSLCVCWAHLPEYYLLCVWVGLFWDARRRCGGVSVSFKRGSLAQCDLDSCRLCCCVCVTTFLRTCRWGERA